MQGTFAPVQVRSRDEGESRPRSQVFRSCAWRPGDDEDGLRSPAAPRGSDSSCIELNSWNFRREDGEHSGGVKFSGEADSTALVYQFKDALVDCGLFAQVDLQGPSAGKGGRQRFDIDCRFEGEEEE